MRFAQHLGQFPKLQECLNLGHAQREVTLVHFL